MYENILLSKQKCYVKIESFSFIRHVHILFCFKIFDVDLIDFILIGLKQKYQ